MTSSIFSGSDTVPQDTLQNPASSIGGTVTEGSLAVPVTETPTQQYGQSQDTLLANMALRGLSTVATTGNYNDLSNKPAVKPSPFAGSSFRTIAGSQSITGVGFKPSLVEFHAFQTGGAPFSDGWATATSSFCRASVTSSPYYNYDESPKCIWIYDGASNDLLATLTSMDSDGFTLNWEKTGSMSVTYYYVCFP